MSETRKPETAPAGPGRLSAQQAAELPDRLLDAAMELFSRNGFAKTTMEGIAKAAGASTKTLYSRYPNKTEVLRDLVRRMVAQTIQAQAAVMSMDPAGADPRAYLKGFCGRIVHRLSEEAAGINRLAFGEAQHVPELARMHIEVVSNGRRIIGRALRQWQEEGRLPRLTEPERAAALCLSMTTDWARINTALGLENEDIDGHVAYAVDLFLRGLGYEADT